MQTYQSVFERELRALITERQASIGEMLVSGRGVDSHERYRELVGEFSGLQWALNEMEEANKRASERERGM